MFLDDHVAADGEIDDRSGDVAHIDGFVDERYAGWDGELGRAILAGERSFDDLERYITSRRIEPRPRSGRQELLENLVNRYA